MTTGSIRRMRSSCGSFLCGGPIGGELVCALREDVEELVDAVPTGVPRADGLETRGHQEGREIRIGKHSPKTLPHLRAILRKQEIGAWPEQLLDIGPGC